MSCPADKYHSFKGIILGINDVKQALLLITALSTQMCAMLKFVTVLIVCAHWSGSQAVIDVNNDCLTAFD